MTVEQITDIIDKNRFNNEGLDAIQLQVVCASKRGSVTEVAQLLKYLSAVLADNSKSAHVLFTLLMSQSHPNFKSWAEHKFSIKSSYNKYTNLLYALYTMDNTGEGDRFMVEYDLNVYSTLYHVVDDIYVTRQAPHILYKLSVAQLTFLRFMFGNAYAIDMEYPKHVTSYEIAYLYNHAKELDFDNKDELTKTIQLRKDYRPLSDDSIYDYSYANMSNGVIINFTHKKKQQYANKHVANLIHEVINLSYNDFVKRDLDDYRFVVFVEKE